MEGNHNPKTIVSLWSHDYMYMYMNNQLLLGARAAHTFLFDSIH